MKNLIELSDKIGLKAKGKSPYYIWVAVMTIGLGLIKTSGDYCDNFPLATTVMVWISVAFEGLAFISLALWHFLRYPPWFDIGNLKEEAPPPQKKAPKGSGEQKIATHDFMK